MKRLVFSFFFLYSQILFSYEKADAFIVKMMDQKVQVLSPTKWKDGVSVIVENKTLTKIVGKVEDERGETLSFLTIKPREFQSVFLGKKNKTFFFVPLSPPFQKVELSLGQKSYEIPPKK